MKIKQIVVSGLAFSLLATVAVTPTTSALECGVLPQSICKKADNGELENSGLWALLLMIVRIMAGVVGFVAVAMIVFAGFLYTTAQDREEQIKKSKDMMLNVVIGLVLFTFMYALLEWLIPGGLFS